MSVSFVTATCNKHEGPTLILDHKDAKISGCFFCCAKSPYGPLTESHKVQNSAFYSYVSKRRRTIRVLETKNENSVK